MEVFNTDITHFCPNPLPAKSLIEMNEMNKKMPKSKVRQIATTQNPEFDRTLFLGDYEN